MPMNLAKESVDFGIVVRDGPAALRFYRDTLGMKHTADSDAGNGGVMHRLLCGTSLIKLVVPPAPPAIKSEGGGIQNASGYRYMAIALHNLEEVVRECEAAGYNVVVPPRETRRPGSFIAFVEDPDGNWIELLERSAVGQARWEQEMVTDLTPGRS